MDIESDDSERWEDFFGSSTDLTPSLIGLYDTLTGSLNTAHNKLATSEEDNNHHNHSLHSQQQRSLSATNTTTTPTNSITNNNNNTTSSSSSSSSSSNISSSSNVSIIDTLNIEGEEIVVVDKKTHLWSDSTTNFKAISSSAAVSHAINNNFNNNSISTISSSSSIGSSKHCSFRVLSPNVQRLISHSGTTTLVGKIEPSSSLESVQQAQCSLVNNTTALNNNHNNSNNQNNLINCSNITNNINNNFNNNTNNNCNRSFRKIIGKHKLSHIPLSRNTCKLTQSGNELVETFETTSSSSLTNIQSSCESLDRLPTPTVTGSSNLDNYHRPPPPPPSSSSSSTEMHKLTKLTETTTAAEAEVTTSTVTTKLNKSEQKTEMSSKETNKSTNFIGSSKIETTDGDSERITQPIVAKCRVLEIAKKFHSSSSSSLPLMQESSSSHNSITSHDTINSDDGNEVCHLQCEKQINESQNSNTKVSDEIKCEIECDSFLQQEQITKISDVKSKMQSLSKNLDETVACVNKISTQDNNLPTIKITTVETLVATVTTTSTDPTSIVASSATEATATTATTSSSLSPLSSTALNLTKKCTPPSSPLLTYARVKVLAANNKPSSGQNSQRISRKLSAENLDRLTDMKPLSSFSSLSATVHSTIGANNNNTGTGGGSSSIMISSTLSPKTNRKSNLILPDVAKLKLRPLSSSSICSTSSSSSSGSENLLNGKLGVSYLASVESLADQSENELLDGHNHNHHHNLTVFERSCLEIIDSERSYVEDLRQIITGYLEDWKERACLKLDELKMLFSNIQEIYDFNSILLKQLINSGMDPIKIAKCFIELKDRFDVYTTYCTSYPEAISLLTTLLQASHTNALLTSTQKMLQHTLPLGSYLLKPVQRILKYHLLLDNLRKHCDIEEVVQAHDLMRQVARNIDQVKRKLEQQSRVKELSGILDGWLGPELTVLGELRQEGLLMENNKPRMVFLFQTMLIITKPKEDNRLQFKSYIYRNNLMLREHLPGEPTSFNVIPYDEPRNQIKLTAKNRDQKRLWAQNIKGVILEQFDIPNRAKELVYKLGDEEDRTPDRNMWKWNFNSSTPVYLERRNQYRRSELRNRSKSKRKLLTNSSSFDGILDNNNKNNKNDDTIKNDKQNHHNLMRKQSVDDTMISSLSHNKIQNECKHHKNDENCNCSNILIENEGRNGSRIKSCIPIGNPMKERSKSVPRIPSSSAATNNQSNNGDGDSDDEYFIRSSTSERKKSISNGNGLDSMISRATSTLGRSKSAKSIEVKMYTTKSIPKRIANLKKSRQKKETSKFYMDLNDFEDTVLKITESSENLSVADKSNEEIKSTTGKNLSSDTNKENDEVDKQTTNDDDDGDATNEKVDESLQQLNESNNEHDNVDGKSKNDVEIISELLKDKGFDRILKKPPKKRSFDNGRILSSPEPSSTPTTINNNNSTGENYSTPPPPPSYSPPPLNTEDDEESVPNLPKKNFHHQHHHQNSEPIYESLLRNVHVPYKFSPILNRSKSQQYYTTTFNELKLTKSSTRPESDYVTLVYTENGDLHSIDNSIVKRIVSTDVLRNSDSNINYENVTETAGTISNNSSNPSKNSFSSEIDLQEQNLLASKSSKNLIQRLISSKIENVSTSENSLLPRVRKSVDNISLGFGKINKPPERRVSDVTEMCRQSIIHRQGSEAVGERMANLDYVDPKTLFTNSVNSSAVSLNPQRDSVFSLTSSSDSVCDSKRKLSQTEISSFIYEDNVEACLENDFRDSAVYSDDNERRQDCGFENHNINNNYNNNDSKMKLKRPSSPPPPPPPPRRAVTVTTSSLSSSTTTVQATSTILPNMKSPNSISPIPPPLPAKPNLPGLKRAHSNNSTAAAINTENNGAKSPDNNSTTNSPMKNTESITSPSGGKSWVLLQIENFNK